MDDYSKIPDNDLVELIRTKDSELFREVVSRYHSKLERYVMTYVNDEEIARDVVQSTFIKTYLNLKGFEIKSKFSSWIYRIAHNEALNTKKRWRREVSIDESDFDISDGNLQMEENILEEEKYILSNCIESLPSIYSGPLILFYTEEKSYEEISDILQITTSTVGTRVRRGRIMLQTLCKKMKK